MCGAAVQWSSWKNIATGILWIGTGLWSIMPISWKGGNMHWECFVDINASLENGWLRPSVIRPASAHSIGLVKCARREFPLWHAEALVRFRATINAARIPNVVLGEVIIRRREDRVWYPVVKDGKVIDIVVSGVEVLGDAHRDVCAGLEVPVSEVPEDTALLPPPLQLPEVGLDFIAAQTVERDSSKRGVTCAKKVALPRSKWPRVAENAGVTRLRVRIHDRGVAKYDTARAVIRFKARRPELLERTHRTKVNANARQVSCAIFVEKHLCRSMHCVWIVIGQVSVEAVSRPSLCENRRGRRSASNLRCCCVIFFAFQLWGRKTNTSCRVDGEAHFGSRYVPRLAVQPRAAMLVGVSSWVVAIQPMKLHAPWSCNRRAQGGCGWQEKRSFGDVARRAMHLVFVNLLSLIHHGARNALFAKTVGLFAVLFKMAV